MQCRNSWQVITLVGCARICGFQPHPILVLQVNGPSVYRTYLAAAQRLGLSDDASGYWELHIKEDERHGRQMVEDVAVKLVDMCALGLN